MKCVINQSLIFIFTYVAFLISNPPNLVCSHFFFFSYYSLYKLLSLFQTLITVKQFLLNGIIIVYFFLCSYQDFTLFLFFLLTSSSCVHVACNQKRLVLRNEFLLRTLLLLLKFLWLWLCFC